MLLFWTNFSSFLLSISHSRSCRMIFFDFDQHVISLWDLIKCICCLAPFHALLDTHFTGNLMGILAQ